MKTHVTAHYTQPLELERLLSRMTEGGNFHCGVCGNLCRRHQARIFDVSLGIVICDLRTCAQSYVKGNISVEGPREHASS